MHVILAAASNAPHNTLTYLQAIVIGVLQGVTELFPISSLGHGVILPQLLGWTGIVSSESASESNFLSFLVGLHVGTAIALIVFYFSDWKRIISGMATTVKDRSMANTNGRLGWLLVVGSVPVGLVGLVLEKKLRVLFADPKWASIFLIVNGLILGLGELVRRRSLRAHGISLTKAAHARGAAHTASAADSEAKGWKHLQDLPVLDALLIGASQILALLAGISRSGVSMVTGLVRGLDHEDAARFTFLLATPIILAAGLYKLPSLFGHNGDGIRGQVLVGSIAAGFAAYASVRFLVRYFETKTLWPFAIYCLVVGTACTIHFA